MKNILKSDYPAHFENYISHVEHENCIEALEISMNSFVHFINSIPENKHEYSYQPEKWSIKDIVQHITDAERIFVYRALRFARNDKTALPGFEEDDYANSANANRLEMKDLLEEFALVRKATIKMFQSFDKDALDNKGVASEKEISVHAIGYIIAGHNIHHQKIIEERYL